MGTLGGEACNRAGGSLLHDRVERGPHFNRLVVFGQDQIELWQRPLEETPGYDAPFAGPIGTPQPLDRASLSQLLYDSLAISAWKEAGGSRWALRVNPSSGNLHPTEVYLIVRGLPDASDPTGATTASLREPEVIIPRSSTVLESNDHVVFFLPNKRLVRDVEKLFRVSATFF